MRSEQDKKRRKDFFLLFNLFRYPLFLISIILVLSSCARKDLISRVVIKEAANPYFGEGPYHPFHLPANSQPEELVKQAFQNHFPWPIRPGNFTVTKHCQTNIQDVSYQAIEVQTDKGPYVILLRSIPGERWWSKIYTVEDL